MMEELKSENTADKSQPSLQIKLEEEMRTVKKSGMPEVSVNILHTLHKTATDLQPLERLLPNADIYIPEVFGWSNIDLEQYKAVAEGRKSPDEIIQSLKITTPDMYPSHETRRKEFEILYNSHKKIVMIDVPLRHPLKDKFDNLDNSFFLNGDFDEDLESYKNFLRTLTHLQIERETYIISNFKEQIDKAIRTSPEFRRKSEVRVLMWLGIIHTAIRHAQKKDGLKTSLRFTPLPYYLSFENEAILRYKLEKMVNDELAAKALLESEVFGHLQLSPTEDSMHAVQVLRKVTDSFSLDEVKKTMEELKKGRDPFELFVITVRGKDLDFELKKEFYRLV